MKVKLCLVEQSESRIPELNLETRCLFLAMKAKYTFNSEMFTEDMPLSIFSKSQRSQFFYLFFILFICFI